MRGITFTLKTMPTRCGRAHNQNKKHLLFSRKAHLPNLTVWKLVEVSALLVDARFVKAP